MQQKSCFLILKQVCLNRGVFYGRAQPFFCRFASGCLSTGTAFKCTQPIIAFLAMGHSSKRLICDVRNQHLSRKKEELDGSIQQWDKIWGLTYLNCLCLSLQKSFFYSYSCWHVGQRASGTCLHLVGETLQQIGGRWLRGPMKHPQTSHLSPLWFPLFH